TTDQDQTGTFIDTSDAHTTSHQVLEPTFVYTRRIQDTDSHTHRENDGTNWTHVHEDGGQTASDPAWTISTSTGGGNSTYTETQDSSLTWSYTGSANGVSASNTGEEANHEQHTGSTCSTSQDIVNDNGEHTWNNDIETDHSHETYVIDADSSQTTTLDNEP